MQFKKKKEKVVPVENRPLRVPGQSLSEELDKVLDEKLIMYILAVGMFLVIAGFAWVEHYTKEPLSPWLSTGTFLVVCAYCIPKIVGVFRRARRLSTGIKREKAVAERLTELQAAGYKVLHDIPGREGNIDHVVIGPAGVFTIETKTPGKRRDTNAKVRYDGQCITVDGKDSQPDLTNQALVEAGELHTIINRSAGKEFDVRPVMIYPDRFVEQLVSDPQVWVFNDKTFVQHIQEQPRRLQDPDVAMIASHLEQYVRGKG